MPLYELLVEAAPATESEPEESLEALVDQSLRRYVQHLQGHTPQDLYALIMPQLERPMVRLALELTGGNQQEAATILGIHRNTLRTKLRALGIVPRRIR